MPKPVSAASLSSHVERIQSAYARAAARIIEILSRLDPSNFTAVDHGRALRDVQGVVDILNLQVRSYAPEAIRAAYKESASVARTRLELIGAKASRRYNQARPEKRIRALSKMILRDFWKANNTIETTARKYLSVMSQAAAGVARVEQAQFFSSETVKGFIKETVKGALVETSKYNAGMAHLTSKDIAARIREKLLAQLGGEDFIRINGRSYNVKSYSELVARTRMRESQTEAVKESMKEFDEDLVEIPRHDNPCPDCAEYQGKVYSVSGKSDKYPELPDGGPPFHPNCEDVMNPVSENALRWRSA
jgi:hypothetical protein